MMHRSGTGPTSALTQFARDTAAYLRGFQNAYQVRFHAIGIQNEISFEEIYNSCTYPLSTGYLTALKAVRNELGKYPDLAGIQLIGREDLLGGDACGMWQYVDGSSTVHKVLQCLQNLATDPMAAAAGGVLLYSRLRKRWRKRRQRHTDTMALVGQWLDIKSSSRNPSERSGISCLRKEIVDDRNLRRDSAWLSPGTGFPASGAWRLALRIHQALVFGQQSAWVYRQLTDGGSVSQYSLTDSGQQTNSAKYVAAKHFFRYIRPNAYG